MEILKFNVFNFLNKSKKTTVPRLPLPMLRNANTYAGVPISHSVTLKESYSIVEMVLQKLCYNEHQVVDMCRFENGKPFIGTARWLCEVSMLPLSVG